jgi:hypothetical protein
VINGRYFVVLLLAFAAPAPAARQTLGIFSLWGSFTEGGRCWAVAEPEGAPRRRSERAFAAVTWSASGAPRGQLSFRLARPKRPGSAVLLRIDERVFQLIGGGVNAWAENARADAEIVSAMRTGVQMTIETRADDGTSLRDTYPLRGAATAIDAAAIACARGAH